jgi:hypothetical protein
MAPKVKTAKNSKLPKLPENCFEPVGKGAWPPISIWIKNYMLGERAQRHVSRGGDSHKGSMSDMTLVLYQCCHQCQRGRLLINWVGFQLCQPLKQVW